MSRYTFSAPARRLRFLVATLAAGLLMLCALACSRTLTPAQATAARAMVGPNCAALGTDVLVVPVVGGALGGIVALLCGPVADDIIAAETVVPSDAGVGAIDVTARVPLVATPGCVPVPVAGDPLGQWACPELAARVRDAFGGIPGEHRKQWVIDQMLREILGEPRYAAWVADRNADPAYDKWDVGVAP